MESDEELMARYSSSVQALKRLRRGSFSLTDMLNVEKEFEDATDRAYAILWATVVEDRLERSLPCRMREDISAGMTRALFEDGGPLETFSAKIYIGYAIGLYGRKTFHDLDLIRTLRNQFAHSRKSLAFNTPEVRKVCATLQIPDTKGAYRVPRSAIKYSEKALSEPPSKNPRTRYAVAAHSITVNLIEIYDRPTPDNAKKFSSWLP